MSSGGSGSSSTNTQVEQIPAFEQSFAQNNQNIAAALGSQPYPTYSGQLIAGFTPQQTQGQAMASTAATAYQPDLNTAENLTADSTQQWNPQSAQQYMSPYAQAALQPQITAEQNQLGLQQDQTNAQATSAGAFGDARQGVENSLNNYNANQTLAGIESTGMNTAYNAGLGAFQTANQQLQTAGSQFASLGGAQQSLGETGAGAMQTAGAQQQQLTQQQLTESYNNFLNQANWGQNELGLQESALSNSPYNNTNYISLAPTNSSAANLGAFSSLAGLLGGGGSSGGSSGLNIFGSTGASSDMRLKRDIKLLGKLISGIPIYEYKYIWDDIRRVGVMAQEILAIKPEAVGMDRQGFYTVDYARIN